MKSHEFLTEIDITPKKPPQHKIKRPKTPTVKPTVVAAIADAGPTVAKPVAPPRPMRMPK